MKKIVLASASPRRIELLGKVTSSEFDVVPCKLSEPHPNLPPKQFVKFLAEFKAKGVFDTLDTNEDFLTIGSDTIVVKSRKIIGKPKDRQDAIDILKKLSGRKHRVYTGVCLMSKDYKKVFYVCSIVKFFKLTDNQIEQYVDTGKPMDKAGAYGIQDSGFVKKVIGSHDCVVGLPTERLKKELTIALNK
ncbi:MAG: septum formation protein Maf [Clostridia bacterium]|nr:septum formation protein Maf [Clostridia bacterium]